MLSVICDTNLSDFIVTNPDAVSDLSAPPPLAPLCDGRFLKLLGDEESVQFRALNFLAGPLQVRCVPEPECCHPCWNDFKRATKSAGLYATMVKATYLANFGAGPYNSGVGDIDLKVAASALMRDISEDAVAADEFWQAVLPEIAFDRSSYRVELDGFGPEDWCSSPVVARRTPFDPRLQSSVILFRGPGDPRVFFLSDGCLLGHIQCYRRMFKAIEA